MAANIAFILICSGLVFLMTPALAFFYGGLERRKNILNTMMMVICTMGLASLIWIVIGYSLSFSGDGDFIGNLDKVLFNGVSMTKGDGIPEGLFAFFQMMFALITTAILTGSVAGRMRFSAIFLFIAIWLVVVYFPMAHMVWGGGFLDKIGSIDFAGGNVVHISSGISGLVLAIVLGRRREYHLGDYRPHNVPFVVLGTGLLWFGWFGFNAGSALKANGLAMHAFMTTAVSAAAGMLSWVLMDGIMTDKPTLVGSVTGLVVGLVSITPGAGFVPIWASLIIGLVGSPICYFMISKVKQHFGYDDALDAFGCHGVGGIWGGIATGLFAQTSINGVAKWNGLFFGDTQLFVAQIISILVTIVVAIIGTLICIGIVKLFTTLRVDKRDEQVGLDMAEHNETAYPSFNGLD